ncbi:MAG: hypothetical protein GXY43_04880 [Clostridiaceae bacterium]|nr:hypothetical protein [Clostridiaceae bacterium]
MRGGSTDETILEKRREEKRREEKRREEKRSLSWLSFLSVLVSILVLLGSSPISLLAEGTEPVETFYSVDESLSFSADAAVTSSWDAHANIDLTFTNCGDETIHNWFFILDLPYEIENIWNASVVSHQEGVYSVKNAGWNQDIPVGGSVTIGFTAASTDGTDVTVMPTFFLLNTEKIEVDAESASLTYQEYSAWGSGFTGALTLSHTLDHAMTDWSVSFSCNRPIHTVNNGFLSQSDDGAYQITNDGNHQNVEVGATRLIGIQGGAADAQISFELSDVHVFMWTQAFSLEEDANANGVADYLDFITGNEPDPDPEIDYETDTDGDGIPDYFEIEWGTDPFAIDTDRDGIDDMTEIYCGMDPLTSDLNEDFDGDGLTLQQEQELGTEFWNEDTDYDGLLDGDEVNTYGTNPILEDTDGDGLLDGDEIDLGLDPLNTNTNGVPDNEYTQNHILLSDSDVFSDINIEGAPYILSAEITASGNVPKYLSVSESSYSAAVYNETMLGTVAELDYEGGYIIEEVKLTFEVRDEYIPNPDSPYAAVNPEFEGIRRFCVFRYFEDIEMLLPVETQYDEENQTAYAVTDLFGTYCLMDMDLWLEQIGILPADIATENTSGVTQIHFQTGTGPQHTMLSLSRDHDEWMMNRSSVVFSENQVRCERYNGHRYAVIDKGDMPWPDAKAYCEYMGGHLVTITGEAEQAFINDMLLYGDMNLYWIGAYRDGTEFRWITGESFEYTNWDGGEPSHESENVVHMYRNSWLNSALGTWNDTNEYVGGTAFHSTINAGLVCEWETPVNVLYGLTLRPCYRASELTNLADEDWDGDGIPNWQEIRIDPNLGYWNIDGKYIPATLQDYMSMYSGLGNPFSRFNLNPIIIPVIPVVSHPENADSDGDGYTDNRDENAFKKAPHGDLYAYSETGWSSSDDFPTFITLETMRGKNDATWGKNPDLINDPSVVGTFTAANAILNLISLICPNANIALDHYMDGSGTDHEISVYELLISSKCATDQYREYLSYLQDHIESVLKDGDTLCVVSNNPFLAHRNSWPYNTSGMDWVITLGDANGAFSVVASRIGNTYTIDGTYYVADVYDFEENDTRSILPGLSNSNMFKLHSAGLARAYYIFGERSLNIEFLSGQGE